MLLKKSLIVVCAVLSFLPKTHASDFLEDFKGSASCLPLVSEISEPLKQKLACSHEAWQETDFTLGSVNVLKGCLGSGDQAFVRIGKDTQTGGYVAVKIMKSDHAPNLSDSLELKRLKKLQRIYMAGIRTHESYFYQCFVIPLIDGRIFSADAFVHSFEKKGNHIQPLGFFLENIEITASFLGELGTILEAGVYHDCAQHNMMVTYAAPRKVHFIDFSCEYDGLAGFQDRATSVSAVPSSYRYFSLYTLGLKGLVEEFQQGVWIPKCLKDYLEFTQPCFYFAKTCIPMDTIRNALQELKECVQDNKKQEKVFFQAQKK